MKLRKKLLLSCAALAACATTLVSTTFAWYTSNTTVTASNITGTSAASGSELLLISQDASNWDTAIADVQESASSAELQPLAYIGGYLGTMTTTTPSADAAGYVEFVLYIKNASTTTGNLVMEITELENTTGTLPMKSVIGANHKYLALSESTAEYKVDFLRALCLEIEVAQVTDGTPAAAVSTAYDLETTAVALNGAFADSLTGKTGGAVTESSTDLFNAHQYYNEVMGLDGTEGKTPIATTDSTVKSDITNCEIDLGALPTAGTADTANNYLKLTFKVFLNGWDLACFDACQGQSFQMGLSFTVE